MGLKHIMPKRPSLLKMTIHLSHNMRQYPKGSGVTCALTQAASGEGIKPHNTESKATQMITKFFGLLRYV
jgi:hypothetical protein